MLMSARASWAAAFLAALAIGRAAHAQQEDPQTLYWGTGLIDAPTAHVQPITGDFAINYMGKQFQHDPGAPKINYNDRLNSNLVLTGSLFGRLEGGFSAFSSNPEWGLFGKAMLLRQDDFSMNGGFARFIPSVAVGARNIGPFTHIDRFGVGYDMYPPLNGDPNTRHIADSLHQNFHTANTFYGVATEAVSLVDINPAWADIDLAATVGYGNGLFKDDGGLGALYAKHATGGLFYGVKTEFHPTGNFSLSLMAENNAWDYNVGTSLNYRGIRAGLYITELGAGKAKPDSSVRGSSIYNYSKVAFTLAWQSNVFALLRGNFLQNQAKRLERQRAQLVAMIAQRQQRIAALELQVNQYEAQNLLELEQKRAQAEAELRQERESLQRLEERLRRIEAEQGQTTPQQP